MATRKYKSLPRSTKFVVEFHDGIHSTVMTKDQIIKQQVFCGSRMSLSLINALDKLESERKADFDSMGTAVTCNSVGYVLDYRGNQHTYSLDMAAHRILSDRWSKK